MNVYGSSGEIASQRPWNSAGSRSRPVARRSSSVIASEIAPVPSIATIHWSSGSWSRTSTILAICSAFSATIPMASELPATHAHSDGEFEG